MDASPYLNRINGHVLVLGGSGGLGAEIVRAVAASGASAVSITFGRNKAAADKLLQELSERGVKGYAAAVNQTDEAGFYAFLDSAVRATGMELSTAINSIGISPNVPLEQQTLDGPEGWRQVFEVNVYGCFIFTRAIAERMKAKGTRGSIVLITSTNGINSQSQISTHYDSSKAAQGHMMKIMAEHYASAGIRINGLAPGWIETSMNDTLPSDEREHEMSKIWAHRFADPKEIAAFTAFVAGTGGSYAYGQNFMVDGGYR